MEFYSDTIGVLNLTETNFKRTLIVVNMTIEPPGFERKKILIVEDNFPFAENSG